MPFRSVNSSKMGGSQLAKLMFIAVVIACSCTETQAFQLDPTNLQEYIRQLQLLEAHCENLKACPPYAECNNYNKCECGKEYVVSSDKQTCIERLPPNNDGSDPYEFPPRQLAMECDASTNCGYNAYCSHTKICACDPGYKPDSSHKVCENVNPANGGTQSQVMAQTLMFALIALFASW